MPETELGISISENAWKRMGLFDIDLDEVFRIMFNSHCEGFRVLGRLYLTNGVNTVITDLDQKYIIDVVRGVK